MATAEQLIDLSSALNDAVTEINSVVSAEQLPLSDDASHLANLAVQIATEATNIGQAALALLANDVQTAVSSLTGEVTTAGAAIRQIDDLKKVLNIVSVVLSGAASIAASVETGNWIGTAGSVATLANNLKQAIQINQPSNDGG